MKYKPSVFVPALPFCKPAMKATVLATADAWKRVVYQNF